MQTNLYMTLQKNIPKIKVVEQWYKIMKAMCCIQGRKLATQKGKIIIEKNLEIYNFSSGQNLQLFIYVAWNLLCKRKRIADLYLNSIEIELKKETSETGNSKHFI